MSPRCDGSMRPLRACSGVWTANGSRLELVFTQDPNGGILVAWADARFLGRAHLEGAGRITLKTLSYGGGHLPHADADAIRAIVADHLDEFRAWFLGGAF